MAPGAGERPVGPWPMGPGTSPRGGRPVTSASGTGAAQPATAAYGGSGPDAARRANPASGAALARQRALEPPPQRGATGPGRHRPPGGAGRWMTAPDAARGRQIAATRDGSVSAGWGFKRRASPPPPRLIKAPPSAARRANREKTAGDGGDERQRRRPRSPNEGGRGHRIAARSAEPPSTTARHEGAGIQFAGRTLHGGRRTPVCRTHVARRASNTCRGRLSSPLFFPNRRKISEQGILVYV